MASANSKVLRKRAAKNVEKALKDRSKVRRDLWREVQTQEDFESVLPQLRKLYSEKQLEKAVASKGFDL